MNINCISKKLRGGIVYRVCFILYIFIWQAGAVSSTCFYHPGLPEPDNSLTADTHLIEATLLISSDVFPPLQTETSKINSLSSLSYNSAAEFSFSSSHFFKQNFLSYLIGENDLLISACPPGRFISRGPPHLI